MKILQLISSLGFYGAENVLIELSTQLNDKGCDLTVGCIYNSYSPHLEVAGVAEKKNLNVQIFPCQRQFDIKTVFDIRRYIKKHKIDVIHSHNYKSNFYALFSTIGLRTKRISTCHNWIIHSKKMKFYASLDIFLLKNFNRIVAVSKDVKNILSKSGLREDKLCLIDNGIDIARFSNAHDTGKIKDDLGIPRRSHVIGTVGRLTEEKGHIHLINAAKSVLDKFPDSYFIIVGDGPLRDSLAEASGTDHIIFTGTRNDIPELYSMMDVFVLPSLNEGLPMVLLEAMVSKKPVVASSVGAIPTLISHGENGLLVNKGDSHQLAGEILKLLEDHELRVCIGERGYEMVLANYSSGKMADHYLELYTNA